ncbi:MAG: SigB/SigF/SigG family RNA polymerase sigma factor [Firmicutes bacterium]|nr:SigB/SigF/SigG family RNA polymerase sigma factor [Bacillota bacterium]
MPALKMVYQENLSYRRDKQLVAKYLAQYEKTKSPELLEVLVQAHWELVEYLAGKFSKDAQLREDLIQVGGIGLTKALQRFDSDRGVLFVTYATPTIVGEIKRYLRDSTWSVKIGRQSKALYYQMEEARSYLTSKNGKTPTLKEISEWLNVDEEKLIEASEAGPNRVTASFQQETSGEEMVLEDLLGDADLDYDAVENRILLKDSMAILPERDRQILYLRYVEGLSQSLVAEMLGISQMHVSRLERKSLAMLRSAVAF